MFTPVSTFTNSYLWQTVPWLKLKWRRLQYAPCSSVDPTATKHLSRYNRYNRCLLLVWNNTIDNSCYSTLEFYNAKRVCPIFRRSPSMRFSLIVQHRFIDLNYSSGPPNFSLAKSGREWDLWIFPSISLMSFLTDPNLSISNIDTVYTNIFKKIFKILWLGTRKPSKKLPSLREM